MDRAISTTTQRRRQLRAWLLGLGALAAALVAALGLRTVLQPSLRRVDILTATVETGDVDATLTAAGTVIPAREAVLVSPIQSTIRRVALAVGTRVQPGQTILELDKDLAASTLAKLDDEQLRNQNKNAQLQLTLARSLTDLQAQQEAQALKVSSLQSALRDEQHLLDIGGGTAEAVRQAELNLSTARLEAERLRHQLANQRQASAADRRELSFTVSMQQRSIAEQAGKLRQADISSPQPGVLTWVNDNLGATVQAGDALARVADLSRYRVRATLADTYADQLHPGDAVLVRLGPGSDLRGTVASISPAVDKGTVTFYATLANDHHPGLRANLRADVFVITRAHRAVLRVKNGPFYQGGQEQPVFVLTGGRAVRRVVRFGDSNTDYVQVLSGLAKGEEVLVSEMKNYLETPALRVE
ncbi:HlyD family efflux transporter periplasmic adaptor subunit [Hymenobacter setariae]|uniref:HlyD family efflux transporter periplasmic adaptor subunit n=1 Tax=Hymenobacter setariae TaxID=2594794 RepID=A0A558BMM6_9BACT|nr:HlyD family efflux transporter periplasmic adaptor subunit [Hymenobacter setariae]TVT37764.1 HlyD family efflux transporter periplasmic adaptor subunit [Hymenobacter setariae]